MNKKKDVEYRAFSPSDELVDEFLRTAFTVCQKPSRFKNIYSLEDRINMKKSISRQIEEVMRIFYDFCIIEKKKKIPIIRNGALSDRVKQEIITRFCIGAGSDKLCELLKNEMMAFFSKERKRSLDNCKIYAKRADIVLEISA